MPLAPTTLIDDVMEHAVRPTLRELAARGIQYRGVLYAGLMLTPDGPKMLEYNVRFGDPECQVLIPRLASDLGALCMASATGDPLPELKFTSDAGVTVVMASEGYPASPRTGDVIKGVDAASAIEGAKVFHAGTARRGDELVTAGGRVLSVTGVGSTVDIARTRAYTAARCIHWRGVQYRSDIAATI